MIIEIKNIFLTIIAPEPILNIGIEYTVEIKDDGTIVDALGVLDRRVFDNIEKSVFPLYKGLIKSYLQLIWDADDNKIYEDCAVNAYGPNREFMGIAQDIDINLIPDSKIILSVHAD